MGGSVGTVEGSMTSPKKSAESEGRTGLTPTAGREDNAVYTSMWLLRRAWTAARRYALTTGSVGSVGTEGAVPMMDLCVVTLDCVPKDS